MEIMKDFIPCNEALELRKLGFNEECLGLFVRDKSLIIKQMPNQEECEKYFGGILAPTFSQAFRFFREKYNQWSYIYPHIHYKNWNFHIQFYDSNMWGELFLGNDFKTYEEAELACLNKLIEICNENNK